MNKIWKDQDLKMAISMSLKRTKKYVKILALFLLLWFCALNAQANLIDTCNLRVYGQIDSILKKVLPIDSLCRLLNSKTKTITFLFFFDDSLNVSNVKIYSKINLSECQWENIENLMKGIVFPEDCLFSLKSFRQFNSDANLKIVYRPLRDD